MTILAVDQLYRLEKQAPTIEIDEDTQELNTPIKFLSHSYRDTVSNSAPQVIRAPSYRLNSYTPVRGEYEPIEVILDDEPDSPCDSPGSIRAVTDFPIVPVPLPDVHPCRDALERYRDVEIPSIGLSMTFQTSQYLNPIGFRRPFLDEEEELYAEWGLPLAFYQLSFKTIIQLLSAILLERKVVVYCKNMRFLSSLVLAIPPLIRPFLYQSVMIPMLPEKLPSLLEAPVPYIIGVTFLPSSEHIPDDAILLDVRKDSIKSTMPVPLLPNSKELKKKCSSDIKQLNHSFKKGIPFKTTKEQLSHVESISTIFETHLISFFANYHNYTICNRTDPAQPITVFMKDSFLVDIPADAREFIDEFLDTQMFFQYSDKRLRKRDKQLLRVDV